MATEKQSQGNDETFATNHLHTQVPLKGTTDNSMTVVYIFLHDASKGVAAEDQLTVPYTCERFFWMVD